MKIEVLCPRERRMTLEHPFQASLGNTLDPRVPFVEVHSDWIVGRGEISIGMARSIVSKCRARLGKSCAIP
jgi:hypothetical protein